VGAGGREWQVGASGTGRERWEQVAGGSMWERVGLEGSSWKRVGEGAWERVAGGSEWDMEEVGGSGWEQVGADGRVREVEAVGGGLGKGMRDWEPKNYAGC
jgi:hypothetical protein